LIRTLKTPDVKNAAANDAVRSVAAMPKERPPGTSRSVNVVACLSGGGFSR
jgi:hypothetical protein